MASLVRPKQFSTTIKPLRGAWGQSPLPMDTVPIMPAGVDIIGDAPEDGYVYGRRNGEWVRVVPLSGATMEGFLYLHDDPVQPLQAATKRYLDNLWRRIDGGTF